MTARGAKGPTGGSIRLNARAGVDNRNGWGGLAAHAGVRPPHRDARAQLMEVAK